MLSLPGILIAAVGCQTDEDCNLNGRCVTWSVESVEPVKRSCACLDGWKGTTCGLLDLAPMATDAPPAYGTLPTATHEGLSSWGGSIVRDPDDESKYHLFASEISHGCGLECAATLA